MEKTLTTKLAIAPKTTQGKSWRTSADLLAFSTRPLLDLSLSELAQAAGAMPIALVRSANQWQLVGVCGTAKAHNLFVQAGKWLGNYKPEICRLYPFDIEVRGEAGVLFFDKASGLMQDGSAGNAFFDDAGKPCGEFATVYKALIQRAQLHLRLQEMAAALESAKVLMAWPEELCKRLGIEHTGLFMLNERALSELDDAGFLAVRKALPLAYGLNFSLTQQHLLERLARINPKPAAGFGGLPTNTLGEIDLKFLNDPGTLKF